MAVAAAPNCKGAHTISLTGGAVSPGSGGLTTSFRFTVRYSDSKNCPAKQVVVVIGGVGTYTMSGSTTFSRSVTVGKAGTFSYYFRATSGDDNQTATAPGTPNRFIVNAPVATPKPTPKPTPRPTPVPTPVPTKPPTPVPTPLPTSPPTSGPTPATSAKPSGKPSATTDPTATASGTSTPGSAASSDTPSPSPGLAAGSARASGTPAPAAWEGFDFTPPAGSIEIVQWAAITGGGLALFLLLATRRRREEEAAVEAPPGILYPAPLTPASGTQFTPAPRRNREDEANMPRWLRPSVQAARQGRLDDE